MFRYPDFTQEIEVFDSFNDALGVVSFSEVNAGHTLEVFQGINDPVKKKCPECGKSKLKRLFGTGAAIVFKGSGFYQTDYRSEGYKKAAAADSKSQSDKGDSKGGESSKKKSDGGSPKAKKSGGEGTGGSKKKTGGD